MTSRDPHAIYLLAFDHRCSFQKKLLGIAGEPTPDEAARISEAKSVIFQGIRKALADGLPLEGAGILVDEQFCSAIAREALALATKLQADAATSFFESWNDMMAIIDTQSTALRA